MSETFIVTGGSGFIGSEFIRQALLLEGSTVINVDYHTYAAVGGVRLKKAREGAGFQDLRIDIRDRSTIARLVASIVKEFQNVRFVHFAAETHVDRSIDSAQQAAETNFLGTMNCLEACVGQVARFLYVSTDEVYGGSPYRRDETALLNPTNPYSAAKAGAEHMANAYARTHGLPVTITRGCNTYGPWQHPEKFIPMMIVKAMNEQPLPVYGSGMQSREWVHVEDHASAILRLAMHDDVASPSVFNITGPFEVPNIVLAMEICRRMNRMPSAIEHVQDRPGHDFCYRMDNNRLKLGVGMWKDEGLLPVIPLLANVEGEADGLQNTIDWYRSDEGKEFIAAAGESATARRGLPCPTT